MSELIPITHLVELKFNSSPYHYFPVQLKILEGVAVSLVNQDELIAINTLRITCCTAFIETILFESLVAVIIEKRNGQSDEVIERILNQKEAIISGGTFRDFQRVSEECLGKKLSQYTSPEVWESIIILFALRNQIAHGKQLTVKYSYWEEKFQGKPEKNYADIINFLKKTKLIEEDSIYMRDIYQNKIVDFFIMTTKQFFIDVTKNISTEFSTSTYEAFQHMRTSLNV